MAVFDETLQFVADLQSAQSQTEVARTLLAKTSLYGLDKVLAGTIPAAGLSAIEQQRHVLLHSWPQEWLDQYTGQNYIADDPLIDAAKQNPAPITWSEAGRRYGLNARARKLYAEAAEFDLNAGLSLPMVTFEGTIISVSLGGRSIDVSPHEMAILQLAAVSAVTRSMQLSLLDRTQRKRPDLTSRERECIRWAAQGKSEWEISQILGISEHTSEKHLLSAKSKLGAVNRVQAVAEAIRLGYIT